MLRNLPQHLALPLARAFVVGQWRAVLPPRERKVYKRFRVVFDARLPEPRHQEHFIRGVVDRLLQVLAPVALLPARR